VNPESLILNPFPDKLGRQKIFIIGVIMNVVSLSAHFDGKSIQLDKPYKLEPNTKLIITVIPEQSDEQESWLNLWQNIIGKTPKIIENFK